MSKLKQASSSADIDATSKPPISPRKENRATAKNPDDPIVSTHPDYLT
jgi:hypothetical protein